MEHLSPSLSSARLATALQQQQAAAHMSPRRQRVQQQMMAKGGAAAAAALVTAAAATAAGGPAAATSPSHTAAGASASAVATAIAAAGPPAPPSALLAVQRGPPDARNKGHYHHLPPLTDAEKKLLFDALPSVRAMDGAAPGSASLRAASLSIVRQWLTAKLATASWVQLIQSIRVMAEGNEHTHAHGHERGHVLVAMGLDPRTLHTAGIPPPLVHRIYKALWVYSEGMHELITEVTHHSRNNGAVIAAVWKTYAILLEDLQGEEYAIALLQVEAESQRVLREMEERFSRSLQLKQDNEVKTQSEVRTLSGLLERSQLEARSLLEKKESLLHAILHLETSNADLDAVNADIKKDLWRTSNQLNRLQGKFEELQQSSAKMEQKLKNDILELKLEQEELKASLDQELTTNERLSYKVDRFASNIADLTTSTSRMRVDLNDKVAEINLVSKVLERTTHEAARLERERDETARECEAKIAAALVRQREAEAQVQALEEAERQRIASEAAERERAEQLAREQEAAGDPIATSPLVLELRAQLAAARVAHEKELALLSGRNGVMSDTIRRLQKRIRELGGGRRFALHRDDGSDSDDSDSSSGSESNTRGAISPRRQLQSVTEQLKGGGGGGAPSSRTLRRGTGDSDTTSSAEHSASSSRRSSRTRSLPKKKSDLALLGSSSAMEVSSLTAELESKEKLNTNLLLSINKLKVTLSQRDEEARKSADTIHAQRGEIAALKEAVSSEQQARALLHSKSVEQGNEIDALRKVEKQASDLRTQVAELQRSKEALLATQSDLTSSLTEHMSLGKGARADLKAARANMSKLKEEVKYLRTECDNRAKNQNELGLRIRTLNMENSSLQSLNEEMQRNLRSSADASSLLGSLESKSAEINRLFLKIRDMEHARIETLKAHDQKLLGVKSKAEADSERRVDDAIATEQNRAKKLRAQIADQKAEHNRAVETLREQLRDRDEKLRAATQANEKLVKQLQMAGLDKNKQMASTAANGAKALTREPSGNKPPAAAAPAPAAAPTQPSSSDDELEV